VKGPRVIILMGPAGAGKTTVGRALAAALGWAFLDGDDFHSAENRARMARAEPLTDADRAAWLAALRDEVLAALREGRTFVLACSALRRVYREALIPPAADKAAVAFVYLRVSAACLAGRLSGRTDHFAPAELLPSQLATLEEPEGEPGVVTLDGGLPVDQLVRQARERLAV